MIGSANSPMSMFTGGGNEAFQRGMMIGNANSPFSSVGDAFRNTLDKYNAHLGAQQEQQNKLDLIQKQYDIMGSNATNLYNAKREAARPVNDLSEKYNLTDPSDPRNQTMIGGVPVAMAPVRNTYGDVVDMKPWNPRALSVMDIVNKVETPSTADSELAKTLEEMRASQSLMDGSL